MKPSKGDKKKKFHGNPIQDRDYYINPITGFLITSDQNREKNAVKDAFNFLGKVFKIPYFT